MIETVQRALKDSGLEPGRLELEITEFAFLSDSEATLVVLRNLRAMGVRIALDDFGTGYSSLSYLHSFPLDKVKIDRSFLRDIEHDPRSLGLLRGVLRLSADLGLSVAVEGVESLQQLHILSDGGFVDEVQGFLFSPALKATEIKRILSQPVRKLARVA